VHLNDDLLRARELARDGLDGDSSFLDDCGGAFGLLACDVEVRDGAEALWCVGVHEDAFIAEAGAERGSSA